MNSLPPKRKLYGSTNFYLRPVFRTGDEYFFLLRPSRDKGFLFELEGEFGQGVKSFSCERQDIEKGEYRNTRYCYLPGDLVGCSPNVKKQILSWATHGSLSPDTKTP